MFDIFLFLICRPWILKKINFILPTDRPKCFLRSARRTTNYFGTALIEISENLQNAWQNLSRHIVKGWEEMKWTSCSVLEIEKHNRWRLWHIYLLNLSFCITNTKMIDTKCENSRHSLCFVVNLKMSIEATQNLSCFLHCIQHLKSHSHLPKHIYLLQWKSFENHEKCFLFHLKSSFCSQDI